MGGEHKDTPTHKVIMGFDGVNIVVITLSHYMFEFVG